MLILTEEDLQTTIEVENKKIDVLTDFKNWIQFSCILNDFNLDPHMKQGMMLDCTLKNIPKQLNLSKTLEALLDFYNCNKTYPKSKKPTNKIGFLFNYDMDLIYAAFLQQYGIDILTTNMHWWKFKSLLDGLTNETKFMQVVGYRLMDISKIKDKNERKRLKELQDYYAIRSNMPVQRTQEEIEKELFERLGIAK